MTSILQRITVRQWIILAVFNLLLTAALGALMRLNVLLPIPAINQKFVLHAHSHFAFSGWVSHALMVFMVAALSNRKSSENIPARYQAIIITNLLASYAMLIGFFLQGYGLYSIAAASATVVISYVFTAMYWRDTGKSDRSPGSYQWFRAALIFLALSAAGTFYLAYLMASGNTDSRHQLAAVHFFLHFQYNGWFFFACMGLVQHWFDRKKVVIRQTKTVYWLFALTCPATYLLSVLWWDMPTWLYALTVTAVALQGVAWIVWIRAWVLKLPLFRHHFPAIVKGLFTGVVIAATIKFALQGLSVVPSLSQLSYSSRPIVIGYLHLVLLVIISLFIIAYAYNHRSLKTGRLAVSSTVVLVVGIVLNELLLMAQGVPGLAHMPINQVPLLLAVAAGIMVTGIIGLLCSQ